MAMMSDLSLQESCMAALRHMGVEVRALVGKTNELEAENERLRELVRTLVYCYSDDNDYAVGCDGCAMNGADMHVTIDGTFACDGLQHELKSLGIEADK